MIAIVLVALVIVAILGAGVVRRSRARALAIIRAGWGHPIERSRRMDAIAASHRSRVAHLGSTGSLDDRTWQDLNLDDVFAALDRTESTLGQHALYHRLRTAPVADHLEAFELLVSRLTADAPARERVQLALSRLQDSHGYDLWWLAGKDAVEIRPWYALFPLLGAGTLVLAVLAPFWSPALPARSSSDVQAAAHPTEEHRSAAAHRLPQGALVTGSNMSGKSTFVRTIGVTTVMAQTLNICFCWTNCFAGPTPSSGSRRPRPS